MSPSLHDLQTISFAIGWQQKYDNIKHAIDSIGELHVLAPWTENILFEENVKSSLVSIASSSINKQH